MSDQLTRSPDVAVSATGLLRTFSEGGILTWADVHPAQHLAHLYGERDDRVRLAIALTVRALRSGSLALDLATAEQDTLPDEDADSCVLTLPWPAPEAWLSAVEASPCVSLGQDAAGGRPLRLVDGLLYLERSWRDQETVRGAVAERVRALVAAPRAAGDREGRWGADQRRAVALAATAPLSIIAGGPGTGKTTIIGEVLRQAGDDLVALAAPTGKAAARLTESLGGAASASTLHRLLGWKPGSRGRFRHDATNPLPHDLVIVDEMSMVSMTLAARLMEALKPQARLVLVGDPDQLSSVEAGAVLADLTDAPATAPAVARLTHTYRFAGAIRDLAEHVRAGDADAALAVLADDAHADQVLLVAPADAAVALRPRVVVAGSALVAAASRGDRAGALAALDAHRLLCAHRTGPYGVIAWARTAQRWVAEAVPGFTREEFAIGRPLMVTVNTPDLDLFNGDTGVVIADAAGRKQALFATGGGPRLYSPYALDGLVAVDAMTIHKAQGSQFHDVSVILPPPGSPLLTRELVYTALTRAQRSVLLVGTPEALREAILRPAQRTSGLARRLG